MPILVAKFTAGPTPMDLALTAYPLRVALVPCTLILAALTPAQTTPIPWMFYSVVLLLLALGTITSQCMFVSQMAFFARVSDPAMGGTYMTLLNTLANLGGMWPQPVTFFLIDHFSCLSADCPVRR